MQETPARFLGQEDPWRRVRLPTPVFLGFPCCSASKESACTAGDLGLIPGLERSSGEGKSYPLQYSGLESSMDCIVHGVAKGQAQQSNFHFHFSLLYICVCVCVCVCITYLLNHPHLPLSHSYRKPD